MTTPNIFDYATSELSQDAFLCWLIACSYSENESLKTLGLDFIRFLHNPTNHQEQKVKVNGLVEHECPYPWGQYKKIDVYFQAVINDKKTSFIIEDKTDTEMHGGQLKRYVKEVEEDEISEENIRKIYFKTGYVYCNERKRADETGYGVIDLEMFTGFLSRHEKYIDNDIFKDYVDYIRNIEKHRKNILSKASNFYGDRECYKDIFQYPYAQYEVMHSLKNSLEEVLVATKDFLHNDAQEEKLVRDQNVGGSPWTQFHWYAVSEKYQHKKTIEYLFWRLDSWYQLRLRHGVWPSTDEVYDNFHEDRKERLNAYRKIFEELGKKIFKNAFLAPSGRTGRESTVGEILFNSPENSVKKILERLPEFQGDFIRRISSDPLITGDR